MKNAKLPIILFLGLLILNLSVVQAQEEVQNGCVVTEPPAELNEDGFYGKYCDVEGIPILSSGDVPDEALQRAWDIAYHLLQANDDLPATMVENDVKIGIIGADEVISDLPDYELLYELFPEADWDTRTRGVGATSTIPMTSGAEENLLCYREDVYFGEDIFVHEFAHTVKIMGLEYIDPTFAGSVMDAYQDALDAGLWEDTYAASHVEEYWAEGIQSYFNVNLEVDPANGVHNFVNTREELEAYDPTLFALIDGLYGDLDWQPACPDVDNVESTVGLVQCSGNGSTATEITFDNQTDETVSLYWVDYGCEEQFYDTIPAGMVKLQPTYETHLWVIRDANGEVLQTVMAETEPMTVTIE